jgi:F-box interacting protein
MEMNTLHLPSELITEILLRLPVKFLIRFKCVSKSWFSLISHPHFAISHSQITSANRILFISHQYPSIKFQCIDFEINGNRTTLNHDFLLPRRPYSHYQIKGSCRGFIFLHRNVDTWIWNPSSGIHKQIPLSPFDSKLHGSRTHNLYGFGYDHSRDDYLVVILTTYDHIANRSSHLEFFSLRDNMWNEIGGTPFTYLSIIGDHTCGSFINGAIHWLADKSCDLPVNHIIVAFDLIERKLFEMPIPNNFHPYREFYSLWVFEEFLSLFAMDYDNHLIEIWVMKEYKQHLSWTKTIVIRDDHYIPFTKPLCGTKSGDIIGKDGYRLVKYNSKGQLLEYLPIEPRTRDLILYTESLFSLPGDCEQV